MATERALRLLITFDCARPSEDALLRLTQLVEFDRIEVTGVYVEDEDLLRAARLPGLREISLTGQAQALDSERVRQELDRDVASARDAFEALARGLTRRRMHLTHRFDVIRGRLTEALARAAEGSDLVLVTRTLRRSGLRPRLAQSFEPLARGRASVLFVNEPWASGRSVVVLGPSAEGVRQAGRLAAAESLPLVVALPPGASAPALPDNASVRRLASADEKAIADLCLVEDARLLVLPADPGLDVSRLLVSLTDRVPCSVLKLA